MGQLFINDTDHETSLGITCSKPSVTIRRACRWLTVAIAGTVLALTLVINPHQGAQTAAVTPASYGRSVPISLIGSGTFTLPVPASKAITYNTALVPVDAGILASMEPAGGWDRSRMVATLTVTGLLRNRGYAIHAHTKPCGATGEDAGPHYQNHVDPAATPQHPSTDPHYANPDNEIWLDVRTDANGEGISRTTVPFVFTDRAPGSIVIHEAMSTATGPAHAGQAGARVACLTLSRQ
jgi:Cu-Zn family superoxide dismutase